jgi:nucleotide-binding universal stress UspA family protein
MANAQPGPQISLRDVLYLTDFSGPSEAALSHAITLARGYGAKVHALHILLPVPYPYATPGLAVAAHEAEEENAQAEMQKVEAQLAGLEYETTIERGTSVWPGVEQAIQESRIDLVVVGTHGRTGVNKLLLGSVAEEIFRRSRACLRLGFLQGGDYRGEVLIAVAGGDGFFEIRDGGGRGVHLYAVAGAFFAGVGQVFGHQAQDEIRREIT